MPYQVSLLILFYFISHILYQKFHSTETASLQLKNNIVDSVDSGIIANLTALDVSAVFDTLDNIVFLHRLQHTFGFSGYVIS